MSSQASHRVAVNTIIMYIRMLFLMVITFFTSRLLLKTLGVEDFGIQSVVGSVAATFMSLKSLFSESVQRFLNFEKGKQSLKGQQAVFSVGVVIHTVLAVFFVIVVGIIGYLLIIHKLTIPSDKMDTALFVFYMCIVSLVISIFSVPFDAVIIANEKMGIYAIITVIDAILRLIAVLLLPVLPFEMLRSYAVLILAIPIFTLSFQLFYCRRFEECHFSLAIDKNYVREIASLSGWNFFGNISFSLVHEGINMLLNVFGGLVYNASRTVAYQVRNAAGQLASNTLISVRPQIMQQAAFRDKNVLFGNIYTVSRVSYFTGLLPAVILFAYTEQLLDIWLVEVPDYAALFIRLIFLSGIVRALHEPLNMMYMSFGKIKRMMLIEAGIMLSYLFIFYVSLQCGLPIWVPFVEMIFMEATIIAGLVINAIYEFGFDAKSYIRMVIWPLLSCVVIMACVFYVFMSYIQVSSSIMAIILSILIGAIYCFVAYFHLDKREKGLIGGLLVRFRRKN